MDPVILIGQAMAAGGLTGARPALTLFVLQLYAAFIAQPVLPDAMGWVVHTYALIVVGALAVGEHFALTDPEFDELVEIPKAIVSVTAASLTAALVVSLGGDPQIWDLPADAAPTVTAMHSAGPTAALLGIPGVAIGAAVASCLSLGWFRRQVMRAFEAMALPNAWWRWLETGTVAGGAAVVAFFPLIAVGLAVLILLVSLGGGGMIWAWSKRQDTKARRPCPSCSKAIRKEALICPACKTPLAPEVSKHATA